MSSYRVKDIESGEQDPLYVSESEKSLLTHAEDEIRRGFASKVMSIVTIQFLFTAALTCIPFLSQEVYDAVKPHAIVAGAIGGFFVIIASCIRCCSNVERKYPWNYIFLSLFTLGFSCVVQASAMRWLPQEKFSGLVLIFAAVIAMTVGLAVIAKISTFDFTGLAPYLLLLLIGSSVFGLTFVLAGFDDNRVFIGLGVVSVLIVFGYMLVILQAIVKGDGKYAYQVDDYVIAANDLYVMMVRLVLELIQLYALRGNIRR